MYVKRGLKISLFVIIKLNNLSLHKPSCVTMVILTKKGQNLIKSFKYGDGYSDKLILPLSIGLNIFIRKGSRTREKYI